MKPSFIHRLAILLFTAVSLLAGCQFDSGPYEETTQTFPLANFDRLDMGSAFKVDVRSGSAFAVEVRGNRSDVNDLDVSVRNGTLHAQYRNYGRNRRYDMNFTITLPTLRTVNFSGATQSTISGFTNLADLDVSLAGASKSVVTANVSRLTATLSGASSLRVVGIGNELRAELSGASQSELYDFPVNSAVLDLSGASKVRVRVADLLTVKASGASSVRYRGTPRINSNVSGASTIAQD